MRQQDLVDGGAQPGGRAPAAGTLRLVQDLVNTVDREHGVELLDGPDGLRAWLAYRGLAGDAPVANRDVRHALALREALRTLLLANGGHTTAPHGAAEADLATARSTLEAAGARARLRATFSPAQAGLVPAQDGVDGALGHAVAAAHAAMATGDWARLKACPRDVCGWAFYDRSPNNGATWCSMQVCGNRTKAAAYQRRHRAQDRPPPVRHRADIRACPAVDV